MAHRTSSSGCGCLLGVLVLLPIGLGLAAWGIGLLGLVMAAPSLVPYLALTDPAQLQRDQTAWLLALGAAPLISFALVSTPARPGRSPDLDEPADRRARRRRHVLQASILLAASSTTGLVTLVRGGGASGPEAFAHTVNLVGSSLTTTVVMTVAFRLWNRWFPAVGVAVTVEQIQTATRAAQQQLQQVRAQSHAVQEMMRAVEHQLATARRQVRFTELSGVHFASFRCADAAHSNYRSVQTSTVQISRMATRARATAAPRLVPLRDPRTGLRHRPDRASLRTNEAMLREVARTLNDEVQHRLDEVRGLNHRTGDLRDTIRDACGERGQRWYHDLTDRRARARARQA